MTIKNFSPVKTDKTKHSFVPNNVRRGNPNKSVIRSKKSVERTNKAATSTNAQKSSTQKSSSANESKGFWYYLKRKLIIWCIISCIGTAPTYFLTHEDFSKVTVIPQHTKVFYVNDYSGSLLDETERFIEEQGKIFYNQTSAQVVVSMVPDIGYKSIDNYSLEMANTWQIGTKDKDNGILLLFVTGHTPPSVRLVIGKGLADGIPNDIASIILDEYAVPYKDKRLFDEAAIRTYAEILSLLYEKYQLPIPNALSDEAIDNKLISIYDKLLQNQEALEQISEEGMKQSSIQDLEQGLQQDQHKDNKVATSSSNTITTSKTFADADFPETKLVPNDTPLIIELMANFVIFLIFCVILKFVFVCIKVGAHI